MGELKYKVWKNGVPRSKMNFEKNTEQDIKHVLYSFKVREMKLFFILVF